MRDFEFPLQCIPSNTETALVYFNDSEKIITMSYEDLLKKVSCLARQLAEKNRPEDIIGVSLQEGVDYVISMLAIWAAGMVYMPLRYAWNEKEEEEIKARFKKADGKAFLDQTLYDSYKNKGSTEEYEIKERKADDLAYLISSSGTSGNPKIIAITYRALMKRIRDHQNRMKISKANNDCMLGLLDYAWDASIMETLSALTVGIPLVIVPPRIRQYIPALPEVFKKAAEMRYFITTGIFIPSILKNFGPKDLDGLRSFLATGEAFEDIEKVRVWLNAGIRCFNGWGPTEVTFGGSIIEITSETLKNNIIPIFQRDGEGLFTGLSHLLLKQNETTKKWELVNTNEKTEKAEVFIAGEGLGYYINDEEKNRQCFIPPDRYNDYLSEEIVEKCKSTKCGKLFRTHDAVKVLDNQVVFSHRNDRIIKRAGKQVNLDDIEKALSQRFGHAIVIYHNRLIKAFICVKNDLTDEDKLHLKQANVYYQITNQEIFSGAQKLPRKFEDLEKYSKKITLQTESYTEIQRRIVEIWKSYFESDMNIDVNDHFVENYGVDSLTLMVMTNAVWNQLISRKEQSSVIYDFSRYVRQHCTVKEISKLVEHCNQSYLVMEQGCIQLKDNIPNYEDHEVIVISLLHQISYSSILQPYILYCKDGRGNPQHSLYEKLVSSLAKEHGQNRVFVVHDEEGRKNKLAKKEKICLIEKIKKGQSVVFNSPCESDLTLPTDRKRFWILGETHSGKTKNLIATARLLWEKYKKNNSDNLLPIYFSLRGKTKAAIMDWLTKDANLTSEQIELLKSYRVLFLLDDYDLLAREDYPEIICEEEKWQLIIGCRARHMLDPRCWQNHPNADGILLKSRGLPAIEKLINDETKRLGLESLQLPDISKLAGKVFSLELQPSAWESLDKRFYLHNLTHFNFIRELLEPFDREKHIYRVPAITFPISAKEAERCKFLNELPKDYENNQLITIRENNQSKPIFAFAPITGDVPDYYSKLSNRLGFYQSFYVFKLRESHSDSEDEKQFNKKYRDERESDLYKRAEDYAHVIQYKYPHGNIILLGWSFGAIQAYAVAKKLQQLNRAIDLIINIDCTWPKNITKYDPSTQKESMRSRLNKIYTGKDEAVRKKAFENTEFNLTVNYNFIKNELNTGGCLEILMIIFKAETTNTGLSVRPEFNWPCSSRKIIEIEDCDHFSIFEKNRFYDEINKTINDFQPRIADNSLEERLQLYCQNRLNVLTLPDNYQNLKLILNGKSEAESLIEIFHQEKRTLILVGEPGSGKTTTLLALEKQFLENYKNGYLPVYINLSQVTSIDDVSTILFKIGLSPQEITTKAIENFVFIIDALDEAKSENVAQEVIHELSTYGRVIVGCRSYYYEKIKNVNQLFGIHVYVSLQPLSFEQMKAIVGDSAYSVIEKYDATIPFLKNPLCLTLILKILPTLQNHKPTFPLSRYELYKIFFEKLFIEEEIQLQQERGIRLGVDIKKAFENFLTHAAFHGDLHLSEDDIDTVSARRPYLIKQHHTFLEYFLANLLFEDINYSYLDLKYFNTKNYSDNQSLYDFLREKISLLSNDGQDDHIHFLHKLFCLVYASSLQNAEQNVEPKEVIAASNAISLLKHFTSFSHIDLSHIHLENTDMDGAVFYQTNCDNSRLEGINFTDSTIVKSSFNGARLENLNFGFLPAYFARDKEKMTAATFIDNEHFAVSYEELIGSSILRKIRILKIKSQEFVKEYKIPVEGVIKHFLLDKARKVFYLITEGIFVIYWLDPSKIEKIKIEKDEYIDMRFHADQNCLFFYSTQSLYRYEMMTKKLNKSSVNLSKWIDHDESLELVKFNSKLDKVVIIKDSLFITNAALLLDYSNGKANISKSHVQGVEFVNNDTLCEIITERNGGYFFTLFSFYNELIFQKGKFYQKYIQKKYIHDESQSIKKLVASLEGDTLMYIIGPPDINEIKKIGFFTLPQYAYLVDKTLNEPEPSLDDIECNQPLSRYQLQMSFPSFGWGRSSSYYSNLNITEQMRSNQIEFNHINLGLIFHRRDYSILIKDFSRRTELFKFFCPEPEFLRFFSFYIFKGYLYFFFILSDFMDKMMINICNYKTGKFQDPFDIDIFDYNYHHGSFQLLFYNESRFAIFCKHFIHFVSDKSCIRFSTRVFDIQHLSFLNQDTLFIGLVKDKSSEFEIHFLEWTPKNDDKKFISSYQYQYCFPIELSDCKTQFFYNSSKKTVVLSKSPIKANDNSMNSHLFMNIIFIKDEKIIRRSFDNNDIKFGTSGIEIYNGELLLFCTSKFFTIISIDLCDIIFSFELPPVLEKSLEGIQTWNETSHMLQFANTVWHIEKLQNNNVSVSLIHVESPILALYQLSFSHDSILDQMTKNFLIQNDPDMKSTQSSSTTIYRPKGQTIFADSGFQLCSQIKSLTKLPKEMFLRIFSSLGYHDLLILSCVCKLFRNVLNSDDAKKNFQLLTTEDMKHIKPWLFNYFKHLFINTFREEPLENTFVIKPHKTSNLLIRAGFFTPSRMQSTESYSFDVPIKLLTSRNFRFT